MASILCHILMDYFCDSRQEKNEDNSALVVRIVPNGYIPLVDDCALIGCCSGCVCSPAIDK